MEASDQSFAAHKEGPAMPRSMRRSAAVTLAVVAALTFALPTVAAAPPSAVTITSPMHFNDNDFNTGTFTAEGPAVDDGLICASGTVNDTRLIFAGFQSGRGAQIPVRKTFTCDGGDQFFVKIQVHLDFETSTETFSWVILGGTGAYESLRGSGSGTTISDGSDPQTGNINAYTGFVLN
jgi:hypothetical protein